jgi:predicted unusual protein kinase regulating ubiquinone biosynthesis (AarF/ABC1/UbiB family)
MATAVDGPSLVAELAQRMQSECDYLAESANQQFFKTAFAHDPEVDIPETFAERTRTTVLTSAFREGADFYAFLANAPPERRNRAGLCMARFAFHSLFKLARLNADPHPGNYVFPENGPVVFLDFGCVKQFDAQFVATERRLAQIVLDDRRDLFRDAVLETGMVPNPNQFDFDIHWRMLCHQFAPYRSPRFQFSFEYVRAGMEFNRPSNPNLRHLAIPPSWIWEQRLVWGLHAVLARLNAEGNFAEVMRTTLAPSD